MTTIPNRTHRRLIAMVALCLALLANANTAHAATAWAPSDQTPWPSVGHDARNWRHVEGTPTVPAPLDQYRLAWVYDWNDNQASKWVVADLDGNGNQEIIIPHDPDGYVAAIEAFVGPLWVFDDLDVETWTFSVPAVGDMDGDGSLDVIFPHRSGWVYRLAQDGDVVWRFDTGGSAQSRALLVDFNGDGQYFATVPSISRVFYEDTHAVTNLEPDTQMFVFGPNGLAGAAPIKHGSTVDPIALRSPSDDVAARLVLAPFQYLPDEVCEPCPTQPPTPAHTHPMEMEGIQAPNLAVSLEAAALVPDLREDTYDGRSPSGPILVNLTGDGLEETVLVTGPRQGYPGIMHSDHGAVVTLGDGLDILDRYVPQSPIFLAAAVGDIVPGGLPELIVGTYRGLEVLEWRQDGYQLVQELAIGTVTDVATADLDADGHVEIVATVSFYFDEARTGTVVVIDDDWSVRSLIDAAPSMRGPDSMMHITIADMDSDGSLDIVAYAYNGLLYVFSATREGDPDLETEALGQRDQPGFVRPHERMRVAGQAEELPLPDLFPTFLLALAMLLLRRRPARSCAAIRLV